MPRNQENPYSATGRDLARGVDPDVLADIGLPVPEHLLSERPVDEVNQPARVPDAEHPWRLTGKQKLIGKEAIDWVRRQYPDLDSHHRD